MGVIDMEGMEFYAYHGCFNEEQVVGNKFIVHVSLKYDSNRAELSDSIHDALNYQNAYTLIREQIQVKSNMLENVCRRILDTLYDSFPELEYAMVKVSKVNPAMGGKMEKVSFSQSR